VYPFISGEQVELAAKDLPLCDFVGVYEVDKLVTLQTVHVHVDEMDAIFDIYRT
jgi:hypothetical protein